MGVSEKESEVIKFIGVIKFVFSNRN